MVRALLDGSKTQTRRVCKNQPYSNGHGWDGNDIMCHNDYLPPSAMLMDYKDGGRVYTSSNLERWEGLCPYGQPGDRLWVRETWAQNWNQLSEICMDRSYVYRASSEIRAQDNGTDLPWRPSIHMPRAASRILLEIVSVRVERLQDISYEDARAEGVSPLVWAGVLINGYMALWESINGAGSWDANPWVWVVEFRRVSPEVKPC